MLPTEEALMATTRTHLQQLININNKLHQYRVGPTGQRSLNYLLEPKDDQTPLFSSVKHAKIAAKHGRSMHTHNDESTRRVGVVQPSGSLIRIEASDFDIPFCVAMLAWKWRRPTG